MELANVKISQPAHRALQGAGIETLDHLTKYREDELLALHGFGPKALGILKSILAEHGLSFKERSDI
jgi:DNA-directed RNA polymerase alpha subunit